MHNYLWQALVRHDKVGTIQEDLEETVRSMESVELASISVWKATSIVTFFVPAVTSTNQNVRWAPYLPKAKNMLSKNVDAASMTRSKNGPKRTGATTCRDYAKMKCYNCNQLGHLSKNYPAPQQEQSNSKSLGKSLAQ